MAFNNTTPLPWMTSHDNTPAYDANDTEMEFLIEPTQVEPAGPSTQTQYWHAIDDGAWGVLEPENHKSPPIKLFAPIVYIGRGPYAPRVVDCIQIDHPNVSRNHCCLRWNGKTDGSYKVEVIDWGTTNGTYIDNHRLPIVHPDSKASRGWLESGSVISLGTLQDDVPPQGSQENRYRYKHLASSMPVARTYPMILD